MEFRPPLYLGVGAIEKGTFGSPLTKVVNFTDFFINPRSNMQKKKKEKKIIKKSKSVINKIALNTDTKIHNIFNN